MGTGNCSDGSGRANPVSGTQDLKLSKAELAFLFGPIKWVDHADQTLECEFGRLGAVENRGLNLRGEKGELGAGAEEGAGDAFAACDLHQLNSGFQITGPAMGADQHGPEVGIGLGCHFSGDNLGLDAAAAQIEGCGDVCEVRMQMVRSHAKFACQSFGAQFEVNASSAIPPLAGMSAPT